MSTNDTLKTIAGRVATGKALSDSDMNRFAGYAKSGDAVIGYAAYAVSRLGALSQDSDGPRSLTEWSKSVTTMSRSALSQRATAVSYIVDAKVDVDGETFQTALTLYGRGKAVRDALADVITAIAAEPKSGKRRDAFLALSDSMRKPAKSDDSDSDASTDDSDDSDDTATRAPREARTAPTMTREEWIETLDALATSAVILADLSDAQHAHVNDTLAEIAARVGAPRTANTGSGRA
jgi:hypothetical protein